MKLASRPYTFLFWFAFLVVLILNLLVWIYVRQVENQFREELSAHLSDVQQVTTKLIEEYNYSMDLSLLLASDKSSLRYLYFQQPLEELRLKSNLQAIRLISPSGEILVSSPENLADYRFTTARTDSNFNLALKGIASVSRIQEYESEKFMSAYAPIKNVDGFLLAVLVIDVKAGFFLVLNNLKDRLLLFSMINFLVIVLIAAFLYRMIQRNLHYQSELKDQEHLVHLGTMAATVAHELRNPLGIIAGTNDVIQKKYGKEDELFTFIPEEIKRLNRLIDEFLVFARSPKLNIRLIDLTSLKDHISNSLQVDYRQRLIISDLPRHNIHSDQQLLEQMLINLILNAFQASTKEDSVKLHINLIRRNHLTFQIIDSGPGISAKDSANIFKPFFTTKEQGTGLGLAITQRLIQHLGGQISFENYSPSGTKFIISIPDLSGEPNVQQDL